MTQSGDQPDLAALVEEAVDAYNAKDFDRYEKYFAEDLRFCHHNRGFGFDDRAALLETLRTFANDLMPDRRMGAATRLVQAGNVVVREQPWGGTTAVDVPGIADKGETVAWDLCSVYVFDGDKVSEYHDYG
jgi:hypothetical protein